MGGFGFTPDPRPRLRDEMVKEDQEDTERAIRARRDGERAKQSRKAGRRRWLRFLRRD